MKFFGIGHDIIEVSRIEQSVMKHQERFYEKLFTDEEIAYCLSKPSPSLHFAGRFAAKEALAKALGFGFGSEVRWKEISILNDENGKPFVELQGKMGVDFSNFHIDISISHIRELASAVAIIFTN
jgi:holo-[acyl-carrier protein] synthase